MNNKEITERYIDEVSDTNFIEECTNCETETELVPEFKLQQCTNCDEYIKPCSMCRDLDLSPELCAECPLDKVLKFANEMSELLFDMRSDDVSGSNLYTPNTNDLVDPNFNNYVLNTAEHVDKIKSYIKEDIIKFLNQFPENYKNEKGEYEYTPDVYDYGYVMDSYIEQLYEDTHITKTVWVCPDCGSDNVREKVWTNPNSRVVIADPDDRECTCLDCESTSLLIKKSVMPRAKVIGFQVKTIDKDKQADMHDDMDGSFCVYNLEQANEMMLREGLYEHNVLQAIWTNDIEEPTIMFEGNVRPSGFPTGLVDENNNEIKEGDSLEIKN